MADHKDFKRLVRARMRKTGESYTTARAQVVRKGATAGERLGVQPDLDPEVHQGPSATYPFDRFSERAKKVLTLAQEEAERSQHSYIGTEHLLLGLLREGEGVAAQVLHSLGVDLDNVRATIESVLGRGVKVISQQILPTSRVKKTIEISFEEARRLGADHVGTEHLLLGLLIEGEGIAAHVLEDLGADLVSVRAEIRALQEAPDPRAPSRGRPARREVPSAAYDLSSLLDRAILEARRSGSDQVRDEHVLLALLGRRGGPAARILRQANLTVPTVRRRLKELPR